MSSNEFSKLEGSVEELRSGLMGFDSRDDGEYTAEERLKCQAFLVFAHAEVENYLERVSRRILEEANSRWKSTFVPDRVIATLIAYRGPGDILIPEDPLSPPKRANLKEVVTTAYKAQDKAIAGNNGIKRSNIAELLCPLGVLVDDLEEVLLIQLNAVGERRGDIVHQPSKVSLPKLRDPFADELNDVRNLINEIRRFDAKLEALGLLSIPAVVPAAPAAPIAAAAPPATSGGA